MNLSFTLKSRAAGLAERMGMSAKRRPILYKRLMELVENDDPICENLRDISEFAKTPAELTWMSYGLGKMIQEKNNEYDAAMKHKSELDTLILDFLKRSRPERRRSFFEKHSTTLWFFIGLALIVAYVITIAQELFL